MTRRSLPAGRPHRRSVLLGGAALGVAAVAGAADRLVRRGGRPLASSAGPFAIGVDGGAITSLRCRGDRFDTDYIAAGAGLGDVTAQFRLAGSGDWQQLVVDAAAGRLAGPVRLTAGAQAEAVSLSSTLALDGEALRWTITIGNDRPRPVEIGELALALPMATEFKAGRPATEGVMKHSFVSGHGSHVFWMRSNSVGPYLVLLPERDSPLEFWERRAIRPGTQTAWCAYVHAGRTVDEQEARAATWRLPTSRLTLAPGERRTYGFRFVWAADYAVVRAAIAGAGLVDVEVVPGMTVPAGLHADIALASAVPVEAIEAEHPDATRIERLSDRAGRRLWRVRFDRLGENRLTLRQPGGRRTYLEFFATEPLETMVKKRGAFIARHQHRDLTKWYAGLLGEWNMATGTLLGPDNYDRIGSWRIYEVTCDDPGLSKPAYLASKNAEHPVQEEVAALDLYIDRFVWGGLQMTTAERYPYAVYGILDWKRNRESADAGDKGRLHVWRPYDYPHVFAMYHAMYRVARDHPHIRTRLTAAEYLRRAGGTAIAMFTVPKAVVGWDAEKTGFYNECVIPAIVADLRAAGMAAPADELEKHWFAKVRRFVSNGVDLFGSEYPFDSTGFESTQAIARTALDEPVRVGVTVAAARDFGARQIAANLFCRGWLEPAYYTLGSDYRAGGADGYTLSYMAQMGGWAVLDRALNDAVDPYPLLRIGYASQLSSWALLNSGTPESRYGYWYSGRDNDGGAGGGFEPAAQGMTWLDQPHHRGSWYYACEIDLGFCGALRAAATIVADDPVFGRTCLGGTMDADGAALRVIPADGVRRRLHLRLDDMACDVRLLNCRFAVERPVLVSSDARTVRFEVDRFDPRSDIIRVELRWNGAARTVRDIPLHDGQITLRVDDGAVG